MTVDAGTAIDGVTWSIDHSARKIYCTARIAFWAVTPADKAGLVTTGQRIIESIENAWSGQHYKCYELVVRVEVTYVDQPLSAPDNSFDIGIQTGIWEHGHVHGKDFDRDTRLSDDPEQRFRPVRSTWPVVGKDTPISTWDPTYAPIDYAHEFGHLLGLGDSYDREHQKDGRVKVSKLKCATDDLMALNRHPISAEMVTRVVRRAGLDLTQVRCPLEFQTTATSLNLILAELRNLKVSARCEDYDPPSDDETIQPRPMVFTGQGSLLGGYLMGPANAGARAWLHDHFGIDTSHLTKDSLLVFPVTFELTPPTCADKNAGRSKRRLVITAGGGTIQLTGWYFWEADLPAPRMTGKPLQLGPLSTGSFLPGPPMHGWFVDAAGPSSAPAP